MTHRDYDRLVLVLALALGADLGAILLTAVPLWMQWVIVAFT